MISVTDVGTEAAMKSILFHTIIMTFYFVISMDFHHILSKIIRYFYLTFFLFVCLVRLVGRGVTVGVAVGVTLRLPCATLIFPGLNHFHSGLVHAEIICQYYIV